MSDQSIYDEDYFIHGKQSGKSLYENYRWLPELTIPMCQAIINHCHIGNWDRILDFGCARGYMVKALRQLGYNACGVDVSRWAIANADEEVRKFCYLAESYPPEKWIDTDWIIAKDVLEHCEYIQSVIDVLMHAANVGIFVVVPLSAFNNNNSGGSYVIKEYELDVTHKQRLTLSGWVEMFVRPGWSVEASYRIPGVKDNYYKPGWERGNGFLTCRRIKE